MILPQQPGKCKRKTTVSLNSEKKHAIIRVMKNQNFETEYIAARKAWIEHRFSALNPMQRQAVMATEGPVLIQRIANLLRFA